VPTPVVAAAAVSAPEHVAAEQRPGSHLSAIPQIGTYHLKANTKIIQDKSNAKLNFYCCITWQTVRVIFQWVVSAVMLILL